MVGKSRKECSEVSSTNRPYHLLSYIVHILCKTCCTCNHVMLKTFVKMYTVHASVINIFHIICYTVIFGSPKSLSSFTHGHRSAKLSK